MAMPRRGLTVRVLAAMAACVVVSCGGSEAPSGTVAAQSSGGGVTTGSGGPGAGGAPAGGSPSATSPAGNGATPTASAGTGTSGTSTTAAGGGGGATAGGVSTAGGPGGGPCDGLMPAPIAAPVEVHQDQVDDCYGATSHPSGVAALGVHVDSSDSEARFPYAASGSSAGPAMASIRGNANDPDTYFHPVSQGFRAVVVLRPSPMTLDYRVRTWDLAGALTSDLAMQVRTIAPRPDGGSVAVVDASTAPSTRTELVWIDADGHVTHTVPLDNDVDRVIVNWSTGHLFAFVGGLSTRPTQGRWYDGSGTPLTPWFDIAVQKGSGFYQRLLQGGVIALGNQGGPWATAVQDGVDGTEAVPAWLAARPGTRLATIRDGRGFAVLPATGIDSFEIVTMDGQSCGTVSLPPLSADDGAVAAFPRPLLDVGWDGTVFQSALVQVPGAPSPQRCVFRWWPALLR